VHAGLNVQEFGLGVTALTIARRLRQQGRDPNSVQYEGQEVNEQVAILAEIHLFLNGVTSHRLHLGDTLAHPATQGATYDRVYGDPPFGMTYPHTEAINNDPRFVYTAGSKVRSAEWLFIQHGLHALKPGGRATFVTVNGPLFRGGPEAKARAALTEAGWLSAAVALPSALYPYTALPVALMVFERPGGGTTGHDRVLFIDAGSLGSRAGRLQALSSAVQARIEAAVTGRTDEIAFSRDVPVTEILTGDAVWQPSRYVTVPQADAPDLAILRSELVKANEALLAAQKRVQVSFARLREIQAAQER
jgi:type I restriction-modification system DNA methylase subunit